MEQDKKELVKQLPTSQGMTEVLQGSSLKEKFNLKEVSKEKFKLLSCLRYGRALQIHYSYDKKEFTDDLDTSFPIILSNFLINEADKKKEFHEYLDQIVQILRMRPIRK